MAWFLTFLLWAAIYCVAELLRPKPRFEDARPSDLGDFNFPTATEGRSVPIVWGRVKLSAPNVIWYGNLRTVPITDEVQTGMFSSDDVVIGHRYFLSIQMAICRGPVDKLERVWIDDVICGGGSAGGTEPVDVFKLIQIGQVVGNVRQDDQINMDGMFHAGSQTEALETTFLNPFQNPLPAYRGTAYWVGNGEVGQNPTIQPFAFEVSRRPDGLNLATTNPGAQMVNDKDANPMNVLYEIMTDTDWGLKIAPGTIDVANFRAAAGILKTEGNGFSLVLDSPKESRDLITEIERQADGVLYFERTAGLWRFDLVRDGYDPDLLDIFDESNIDELTEYSRTTWEETSNQVRVSFIDADDAWKQTYALAQDIANAQMQGGNVSVDLSFPGVKDRDLANSIAWRELRVLSYPLAKCSMKVNRRGFNLIPGGLFRLSWGRLGISEIVFRVTNVDYGNIDDGKVTISAVQDIFATGAGVFGPPTGTGWGDPLNAPEPVDTDDTLVFEAPRQMVIPNPVQPTMNPRAWAGALNPGGGTSGFQIYSRFDDARPLTSLPWVLDGRINRFLLRGVLDQDVPDYGATAPRPATDYVIEIAGSLDAIEVSGGSSLVSDLITILYIDGEFIGYEALVDMGAGIFEARNIYRGLFHSAPKPHTAGAEVWFIGQGGGNLTNRSLTASDDEMDLQLRSFTQGGAEVTEGDSPIEEMTLDRRWRAPLAPRDPILHASYAPASATLDTQYTTETGMTGENARALKAAVTPRAWRVDNVIQDTILSLSAPDYLDDDPVFDFLLRLNPGGTPINVEVVNISGTAAPVAYILRNKVIEAVGPNASIPSTGRLLVTAKHTPIEDAVLRTCPVAMEFDFTVTTALQGQALRHGAFLVNSNSTAVIYNETGTYNYNIYTALPATGILEASINLAAFVTVVSAGNTSGTLALTASDSVRLRFSQAPTSDQFFDVTGPITETGYGVFLA